MIRLSVMGNRKLREKYNTSMMLTEVISLVFKTEILSSTVKPFYKRINNETRMADFF